MRDIINNSLTSISLKKVQELRRTPNFGVKAAIVVFLVTLLGVGAWTWSDLKDSVDVLRSFVLGKTYLILGEVLLAITVLEFLWRLGLFLKYRPADACTDEQLPTCTVVVPAYNEGSHVLDTLRSLVASDYPPEKLEIIGVDDGSKDDTWVWLQKAQEELAGRVKVYRLPVNQGKRHALAKGFESATGEVLVTVDSDSVVVADTLRRLVSPMYHSSQVGAVAGNVRVLNRSEGFIPRMMDVSFAYSFDFIRASQSILNSVLCTPGALSAYRKDIAMKVLPEWLNQKWMGKPANIGEDRALTNLILRSGHEIHFQSDAMVWTKVPTDYPGLCKMFLRWARSNVRENVEMSAFAYGKFRSSSALGARINLSLLWLSMITPPLMLIGAFLCLMWKPGLYSVHIALGTAVASTIPAAFFALRYRDSNALWSYLYGFFWLAGLWWINPYAILTAHKDRWLTREITVKSQEQAQAAATAMGQGSMQNTAA
jgi:hyaluronan synthase